MKKVKWKLTGTKTFRYVPAPFEWYYIKLTKHGWCNGVLRDNGETRIYENI